MDQNLVVNIGKQMGSYENSGMGHCLSDVQKCIDESATDPNSFSIYGIAVSQSVGEYSTDLLGFQDFNGDSCL